MRRKLTLTIDEAVYEGLHRRIGARRISGFVEDLVRPYVLNEDLEESYRELAADEESEREAREWIEGTFKDWLNESW